MNANTAVDVDLMTVPGADQAWVDKLKKGRPYKTAADLEKALGQTTGPLLRRRVACGSRATRSRCRVGGITVLAQDAHQHGEAGKLGTVKFTNSCSADVQPAFGRGMALLHSFEFGPAMDDFKTVVEKDSSCGIALWATALAQWGNPFSPALRPAAQLHGARVALSARRRPARKRERERGFIARAAALYDKFETVDQRTRLRAYRDAMAGSRTSTATIRKPRPSMRSRSPRPRDPADKTYVDQLKAGAILEKLWRAQPEHPGMAHYIIHSYDVPALASRAVDAARRYAKIAPAAPHALHMPSHTFTRLGYWQDSIDTNILSAEAARKTRRGRRRAARARLPGLRLPAERPGRGRPRGSSIRCRDSVAPPPRHSGRRAAARRRLCGGGDPGPLRARARRVGRGRAPRSAHDALRRTRTR